MTRSYCSLLSFFFLAWASTQDSCAANWQISSRTSLLLDEGQESVSELSGITYLGESTIAGKYRFAAVQDEGGKVLNIDVEFSPSGSLASATAVSSLSLTMNRDFEGIAYTNPSRNSVFISEEPLATLREFSLTNGGQLQTVATPPVFSIHRGNLGFESLTRSPDGTHMWTANEAALTVDGDVASSSSGTTVRLLHMSVSENSVTPIEQFAYQVEPIHGTSPLGSPQSGLSDLVALPDGSLLALERSVAFTAPIYLSRIFAIDVSSATDVSAEAFAAGLVGQTYTLAAKELLWSGAADSDIGGGQNLEGLALGPRLANGDWVLLGVVDNGDGFSENRIVAFVLSSEASADFDEDGDVDGNDFLLWQRGSGMTQGAAHSDGDADRDGDVDATDLELWQNQFPKNSQITLLPEPHTFVTVCFTAIFAFAHRRL